MSDTETTGAHEKMDRPDAEQAGPIEVHVGGGGDPLVFGLPVFVSGSLVLGFALIGLVSIPDSLGSVLPETTFATGLGEFVTALWAIVLGQTIVAAIFGLFAAFWFSLFAMLMGIFHKWYAIPTSQVTATEEMFFLAWLIIFVFLTLAILRLPISYVLIMIFVDIAVLFVLLAIELSQPTLFIVGGAGILAFCAVGLYAFLNLAWVATGAKRAWPPLGPAPVK
ncbi:MAG: GPR1/FUN34/YaaH family transporter [Sciscionella sp.]